MMAEWTLILSYNSMAAQYLHEYVNNDLIFGSWHYVVRPVGQTMNKNTSLEQHCFIHKLRMILKLSTKRRQHKDPQN